MVDPESAFPNFFKWCPDRRGSGIGGWCSEGESLLGTYFVHVAAVLAKEWIEDDVRLSS